MRVNSLRQFLRFQKNPALQPNPGRNSGTQKSTTIAYFEILTGNSLDCGFPIVKLSFGFK
ncbi:hypothetical protein LEP1GSC062_0667 [Leptospira alexanderi serovar Manhao 3 str. L 60]|uniref:Uncharacterized protein n=1 Tax=Leptospira alexanderi serovar Manhao 3 str. L 60 TaxID=1049759 RepID=V6I940_9LEPT|nr:hypothetical protein LEP1GSC062_0667 [Leptospira alexanderi serovar Manhao 3 str. L 60]